MTKLWNKIQIFIATTLLLSQLTAPINVLAKDEEEYTVAAKAAIAIDANTGKIFYEKNADKALPIASMTKLITLYLVLESIDNGKLDWDDQIEISDHLLAISQDLELSNIPLTQEKTYSVRDLFNASALVSANAAVTALAEKIAGTEKDFVDLMRKKVEHWGITDAYLISTSGINNEYAKGRIYPGSKEDEENLVSAKDMAIIARHLVNDFPEILDTTKEPTIIFDENSKDPIPMNSTNWMLPDGPNFKEGIDGLKTGTTDLAGECFAATYVKDGTRIITIIMNADNVETDPGARFVETSNLIDYVYDNWEYKTIYKKGDVAGSQKVKDGVDLITTVLLNEDVTTWVKTNSQKSDYPLNVNRETLKAGLAKDRYAGTASVSLNDNQLGFVDDKEKDDDYQLKTSEALKKAPWYQLIGRNISNFFTNLF